MPYGQVPIVQHATASGCVSIGQTAAAAQFIGSMNNLAPTDPGDLARATSACIGIQEMYNALFYGSFVPRVVTNILFCKLCPCVGVTRWRLREKYDHWMGTYERWLRNSKPGSAEVAFLAGEAMSFADVCLFDCIEGVEDCGYFSEADRLSKYPLVSRLYSHVGDLPAVSKYIASRGSRF